MSTLQEFIAYTKGWEYIIAIGFLASFIVFWKVLGRERPEREATARPAQQPAPGRAPARAPTPAGAASGMAVLEVHRLLEMETGREPVSDLRATKEPVLAGRGSGGPSGRSA